jgi:hypothetical protein
MSSAKNAPFSIRNFTASFLLSLAALWSGVPVFNIKKEKKKYISICVQKLDSFFPLAYSFGQKGKKKEERSTEEYIIYKEKILTATSTLSSSINVSTTL